ncbi:dipeptidyl aminopeptidase/acylaminoacyl peptidase [Verticillium alfalfae VaMs.102]|uniref:Dipeptidyl aminopeptidase/acylaminoacyl peptidase n=1 Tax=Verticillium alfalfae (strain VaMs.102 / ATCC MYA-4576 / FGSC 10136) TaxID=526221 RepID=C9S7C8_VERA1|nr:dipeptidyl aminopeptidase/acylaminoacyl peptidase [Verticillium alfalfae VaMs.102]EEY15224.1 dipeptidyl aminopeptidase/acylaminoacyl peptidase [Verticillium alfalfae VaMs.102]
MKMVRFSKSDFMDFELHRILSAAPFEGSEIAEFLQGASLAAKGPEQWHQVWNQAGEQAEAIAYEAAQLGDAVSARKAHLRACNYFRASQYMMFREELPRILPISERSVRNFRAAIPLLENCASVETLAIPYTTDDGATYMLPGYLYLPAKFRRLDAQNETIVRGRQVNGSNLDETIRNVPIILATCGADSTQEEHYFMVACAAVERGYAALTFEGPGQGTVLRASMGGYLALRGASDTRISACVSIDPFYSLWDFVKARMPGGLMGLWESGWIPDSVLNGVASIGRMLGTFQDKWELENSKWMFGIDIPSEMFGIDIPSEMFRRVMHFTLGEVPPLGRERSPSRASGDQQGFLHRIKCPVLVSGAGQSLYFKTLGDTTMQIQTELVNVPESDKKLWFSEEPGEGGIQAKIGAFGLAHMRTFAFLDKSFGIQRQAL